MAVRPEAPAAIIPLPAGKRARRRQNLLVPMRDGVQLALDVLLPDGSDQPRPTVLIRTCYDKNRHLYRPTPIVEKLLSAGYAVAAQDVRGRFNSDGNWGMYFAEFDDGHDTLEWMARQPWCDGNIGMYGGSYEATTQWFAARGGSPHLKAIVPIAATPSSMWANEPIRGGAFLAPMVQYAVDMGLRTFQSTDLVNTLWTEDRPSSMALPFASIPSAEGSHSTWIADMLDHPTLDTFWQRGDFGDWSELNVAALHITGWWDMNLPGALDNFPGMRAGAASVHAREAQRLVIGPWPHWLNQKRILNGVDFGESALIDLDSLVLSFYDEHLKGAPTLTESTSRAHIFVIGANEWWGAPDWPLPEAVERDLFLGSSGGATTCAGKGSLTWQPPADTPPDTFDYDPHDPVHEFFHMCADGPLDDRIPSLREDVLCYTTSVLTEPLHVVGPVSMSLWASSSARDTDWHVRLIDVHPDGAARYLCHGVLRARFRNGFQTPELLEPGTPYEFHIPMDAVAIRFDPGHRIRLEITSSWSPRYDRNTNSGADNPFHDATVITAHQSVFHDRERPSRLSLPVIDGSNHDLTSWRNSGHHLA